MWGKAVLLVSALSAAQRSQTHRLAVLIGSLTLDKRLPTPKEFVTMATDRPTYRGGRDIAMKLPPPLFESTERFYVETLGLIVIRREPESVALEFGANRLWLDRAPGLERPEVWLEVVTRGWGPAEAHLRASGTGLHRDLANGCATASS